MKTFVFILSAIFLMMSGANAADTVMTCKGDVVMGTAVFQKIKGINTKLRVEGRIGNCPFSTTGNYVDAGDKILKVCSEADRCTVRAIVGQVTKADVRNAGSGCCKLWIKTVLSVEKIRGVSHQ